MGSDKSMIIYHNKPQCYYIYEMLGHLCKKVFLCCNALQTQQFSDRYNLLPDLPVYENIGPAAALLTAFNYYPDVNFLAVGCDYPFINEADLQNLLLTGQKKNAVSTLYNNIENLYEPLLAWYPSEMLREIAGLPDAGQYSLQHFLKSKQAVRVTPGHQKSLISVDTPDAFMAVKRQVR